jgi:hypothetical protein
MLRVHVLASNGTNANVKLKVQIVTEADTASEVKE